MRPNIYHHPTEIKTAVELVKAGATPLMLSPRPPLAIEAEAVVDLSQLGLSYIREEADGLHIGALTPLQEIAASPLVQVRANGILSEAAALSAHLGLRHISTLGGALLTNDGPPEVCLTLYVLNAQLRFLDAAQTEASFTEWRENPVGVVSGVRLPNNPLRINGALERIARTPRDAAILAVAATVTHNGNRVTSAQLAIGHNPNINLEITPSDGAVTSASQLTHGLPELIHTKSVARSDYLASAEYRREMAVVLAHRAIEKAFRTVSSSQ